ncbi:hypothetical protein KC19_2G064400 [Ceratodon purpureus]|uniref:Uncharacterized protein n=1 Tax=Ceratodon purpureus TaxID=3225 RepID=A0A8T0ISG0_CERPU|nr:hypothetical protein KC19_2G064400 [Ceratodon purpureus]
MERECGKLGSSMSRRSLRCALYVVSMACLWRMVAAQAAAPPPISDPPAREGCPRELVSTVWGFILTFVALSLDDIGSEKNGFGGPGGLWYASLFKAVAIILFDTVNPIAPLCKKLRDVLKSFIMRKWLSTPKESVYIRTLISCNVVVNLSPAAYDVFHGKSDELEEHTGVDVFHGKLKKLKEHTDVFDFSDVFVLGNEVSGRKETNVQLSNMGKAMLVKVGALPPIERLKIVQGHSGIAVVVAAAQGGGYIYGILVRLVQGLHVSPIEVIGFYMSIFILVRAVCHYFASSSHRPLYLFLEDEMEKEFIKKCQEFQRDKDAIEPFSYLYGFKCKLTMCVAYSLLYVDLVFFLIYSIRSTSVIMVIPLIIIMCSLLLSFVEEMGYSSIFMLSALLHILAYICSIVLTWKYWTSFGYDIPTRGYVSKILPYIG